MSVTYIGAELRRLVVARSNGICEYCLIAEDDTFYGCKADHIISEKHGGRTDAENLAFACVSCNQAKGSDIGSMHWETEQLVRFYNPRTDRWADHFELVGSLIDGLSPIGHVTAQILGFNTGERVLERQTLQSIGRYRSAAAMRRMQAQAKTQRRRNSFSRSPALFHPASGSFRGRPRARSVCCNMFLFEV